MGQAAALSATGLFQLEPIPLGFCVLTNSIEPSSYRPLSSQSDTYHYVLYEAMLAKDVTLGPDEAADEAPFMHQTSLYEPLPSGRYIRFLLLEPGEPDDPIVCKLHTSELDEANFEALSYVWGTPSMTERISCNNESIYITVNLMNALVQARNRFKPRALWVDAICINQEDREEKGLQVALMAEIYKRSTCTVICLGRNDAQTHAVPAADLLADVNAMMDRVLQDKDFSWKPNSFPESDADLGMSLSSRIHSGNPLPSSQGSRGSAEAGWCKRQHWGQTRAYFGAM